MTSSTLIRRRVADAARCSIGPDRGDSLRVDSDRRARHNATLTAWLHGEHVDDDARAMLDLLAGVMSWCADTREARSASAGPRVDPFSREYVAGPLIAALRNASNYEMGALYGAAVSDVIEGLAARCEVDS